MKLGPIAERLAVDRYVPDERTHIELDQALARSTGCGRLLVRICPAQVYTEAPDGTVAVQYAACLECGTCLALVAPGTLRWRYPSGGRGIVFREG